MPARKPWLEAAHRPAVLALLISLTAHAWWLLPLQPSAEPPLPAPQSLRIVQLAPRAPAPLAAPPGVPAPSANPQPVLPPSPAAPTPAARPAEVPETTEPQALEAVAELSEASAIQADLPSPQRLRYRLQLQDEAGMAELLWAHDGRQYRLQLQRQLGERELPSWQSEGRLGDSGLVPARFEVRRQGRLRQTLRPQPPVQDRLSWLMQLALAGQLSAGGRPAPQRIELAGWRGGVQRWVFEAMPPGEEEMPAHWLHWRGQHPADARFQIDVWLDPARGHLPVRWRQRFDEALRSDLQLLDSEPLKPVTP